jgi:hypothetical protein
MTMEEILLGTGLVIAVFGAVSMATVVLNIWQGADIARSELAEFRVNKKGQLAPMDHGARTGRLTGGITPKRGMTYVPSDELVDSIH